MTAAGLFVAGAMAFCNAEPAAPECAPPSPIVAAALSPDRLTLMETTVRRMRFRFRPTASQGPERDAQGNRADVWRVAQRNRDDCEERVLRALAEIRNADPQLGEATRPLLLRKRDSRRAHLVISVTVRTGMVMILDPAARTPRRLTDYRRFDAYAPGPDGIGGRWVRVTP